MAPHHLIVVTYNVHGGVGMDGRLMPARQLQVLRQLGAHCIALQEFVNDPAPDGGSLLDRWAGSLGMHGRFAPSFVRNGREFGNAVLTRFPFIRHVEHDISAIGCHRRVALDVMIHAGTHRLHMITVHCAVRTRSRRLQMPLIQALLRERPGDICILLGDFNEWRAWNSLFRSLREDFAESPPRPTFPALSPFLPLDRIWVHPPPHFVSSRVETAPPARLASDHLPMVATISLDALVPTIHEGSLPGPSGDSGLSTGPASTSPIAANRNP